MFSRVQMMMMSWILVVLLLFVLVHISTGFKRLSSICNRCIALQSLSDEDIDELVLERVLARKNRDFVRADSIKQQLEVNSIQIIDTSYQSGGTSTWRRLERSHGQDEESIMDLAKRIAHSTADSVDASLLDLVRKRLQKDAGITLASDRELTGRAYADIALYLALAGVQVESADNNKVDLFGILVQGGLSELNRTGMRDSNRIVDILTQCEKIAAAGVTDQDYFLRASEIVREKIAKGKQSNAYSDTEVDQYEAALRKLSSGAFTLFNARSQAIIFRQATALKKVDHSRNMTTTQSVAPVLDLFVDPTLPLIVDLGCGFGLSLLGMAYTQEQMKESEEYNFLGIDLSVNALRYASGLSQRWKIDGNCQFLLSDALTAVGRVQEEYPGEVALVSISYPSPFPCNEKDGEKDGEGEVTANGNTQLPQKSTFLLQANLVETISNILRDNGTLFLQSNAEDVLLYMKRLVESTSTSLTILDECVEIVNKKCLPSYLIDASKTDAMSWVHTAPPARKGSRLAKYLASSCSERATGIGFLSDSPFKNFAKTETEAVYTLEGRVDELHRVMFLKERHEIE